MPRSNISSDLSIVFVIGNNYIQKWPKLYYIQKILGISGVMKPRNLHLENDISGGPGSGKVSHSQRLSQELISNDILHLNVTELLKDIYRLNGKWLE